MRSPSSRARSLFQDAAACASSLGIIHNDYRELAQAAASWNRDLALELGERIPTDLLLEKAQQLFIKDHVKEALPLFEELVRRDNPRAMYFMGEILPLRLGRFFCE